MASIEHELSYDVQEEIEFEGNRRVVIIRKEMEVLDELVEEGAAVDPKAAQCSLCQLKARHPARHALEKHLWYCSPQTACWICKKQDTRLHYHAKENHRAEERSQWDEFEYAESWVQLINGLFRALAASDQQHWLKSFEEYKSATGISLGPLGIKLAGPISIAALHFHIDTLLARTGCSGFHELSDYGTREHYKTCLMFMVANFCFPSSWPSSSQSTELRKTPSVHFSFGIHPRIVNSNSSSNLQRNVTDLEYLIQSSMTVAFGECGLDTSDKNVHLTKQIDYLEKQIQLAVKKNLPVVIHCRGDESLHRTLLTSLVNCC
ncbi:tatD [Mytilus coruscus]|uniref:TatD n=1 Tax=Mytilus coruscus TaxID=42192 RepID=A0A6J8B4A3_MYTCO|nr:tatD [Mytilus coruscus]